MIFPDLGVSPNLGRCNVAEFVAPELTQINTSSDTLVDYYVPRLPRTLPSAMTNSETGSRIRWFVVDLVPAHCGAFGSPGT
jgi:hypothetical protein